MTWPPGTIQGARSCLRSTPSPHLRPYYAARAAVILRRHYAQETLPRYETDPVSSSTLAVPSTARYNDIGVQHLSTHIHPQVFSNRASSPSKDLVQLSKDHLTRHELLGKNQDGNEPVAFDLPRMYGSSLDEHFHRLGLNASQPYLQYAEDFVHASAPQRPRRWARSSGWTKYHADGTSESVDAPSERMLSFDVEVMWKESSFAVMACAMSPTHWYAWLSPWLLGESQNHKQLIPLGDPTQPRIIIGHNIGYDRARVQEEYDIKQSKNFFIDTMSLHVAVNGMCSQQRPTWMKHQKNRALREKMSDGQSSFELGQLLEHKLLTEEEEELWVGRSSINSLRDVAKFHTGITIDKSQRDYFGELDRSGVNARLDELLDYCAADVAITHKVYQKVFPNFLQTCPHPVSFGALRHLSSVILPVNETWNQYLKDAENTYVQRLDDVSRRLMQLCDAALADRDKPESYHSDPWLSQLDWSGQAMRFKKAKKKDEAPVPVAKQKKPGMPQWFKDLFVSNASDINLTVRTRIAPLLLKLTWDGYPLVWSDKSGWTFKVPCSDMHRYENTNLVPFGREEETNLVLKHDHKHMYLKLPHKDGPSARCASPLAKGYLQYFEAGRLSSQFALAKEALEMNASCAYWISARDRITSQMVVMESDRDPSRGGARPQGFILPQIIPMGTITRRAVENTWLTASNAKANRVGSELKAMIKAPPGYALVGADVDSEELWIAALVGDAQFQLHGGNAMGFMTLEGTKAAGTDLHSRTATILGISRNDAKVFNYGRIYGAGVKFAAQLLRQFNPSLSETDTAEIASKLYHETKGTRTRRKALSESSFWRGGTESLVFNKLEEFAEQERPRTPVLGAGITEALMRRFINQGSFMTSRINWAIQSSGVDYLHMLIIAMDYLIRRFDLDARLAITVHDEIRYLVRHDDRYKAAMALQVANVWTRAMFSQQMGIDDLPQACAFFSQVDIDHVLRKEVDMNCVTPSQPHEIPPGESLDIRQLLAKGAEAYLDPDAVPHDGPIDLDRHEYTPRPTVMSTLDSGRDITFIKAQLANDDKALKAVLKEVEKPHPPRSADRPSACGGAAPSTARGRRSKPKVPPPPHAQPQRAVLMEVADRWGMGYRTAFARTHKPWISAAAAAAAASVTTGGATKHAAGTAGASDGWEV